MIYTAVEDSPGGFHDLNGAIKDQVSVSETMFITVKSPPLD